MSSSGTAEKFIRALALVAGLVSPVAFAETPAADPFAAEVKIDADAEKYMRAACEYLDGKPAFSVRAEGTFEEVFRKGRRVQRSRGMTVELKRPDRMWAEVQYDKGLRRIQFDGKSLAISDIDAKVYGKIDVPGTVEHMLTYAAEKFDVVLPLMDLLSDDPCAALESTVERGWYLGKRYFDGGYYHHLFFSAMEVDLQVWVSDGDEPLFRKLVLTYKNEPGEPQYGLALTGWNFAPPKNDARFEFTPAKGAREITFVTAEAPATGAAGTQE